jgi:hypothetical protein
MKESPESLISAPLSDQVIVSPVAEMHHIQGLLLVAAGSWSLSKLLGLGRGTTRGSTDILMMLRATIITMSLCLQDRILNMSEYKACVLKK